MILLKSLLSEKATDQIDSIVVGSVNDKGDVIGSDKWKTHGTMTVAHPEWHYIHRYDWRYSKRLYRLFWWEQLHEIPSLQQNRVCSFLRKQGLPVKSMATMHDNTSNAKIAHNGDFPS